MKKGMFTKLLLVSLTFIISTVFLSQQSVFAEGADAHDDIDGQITSQNFNNPARVINLTLVDSTDAVLIPGTSLTPQASYTVKIEVFDADTIGDINSFGIKFFYFDGTPENAEVLSTKYQAALSTEPNGEALVMEWNVTTGAMNVIDTGASSTWEIMDSTVPTHDLTDTVFTFEVTFKISKVAHESNTPTLNWYFGTTLNDGRLSLDSGSAPVDVVDYGLVEGVGSDESNAPSGWSMNWYGEVTVSPSASISWDDVLAGRTFQEGQTLSGISFISNGNYQTNIKSSDTWEALITQELAEVIFAMPITTTELDVLLNKYNELFVTGTPPVVTGTTPSGFVGLSFDKINQTALSLIVVPWIDFQIHLPQSSTFSNLTGASLVTEGDLLNTPGFTEQFFALQFEFSPTAGTAPFYVGTEFVGFKPTVDFNQTATNEIGHTYELLLMLGLSDVFQNGWYKGKLVVQIVNP